MASQIRLLLLEDTPADAELIERELKRAGLNVLVRRVDTEREFRQHLNEVYADVILADYSLPGFDGEAALEIAHELVPEVPFIFVSGSIGEERAIAALRKGATDYILKDRLSRLGPAVKRALDERRQRLLRRAAQEALRLSAQRFEYATRATSDALWDWDLTTDEVWIGETMEMLTGCSRNDQHGAQWWFTSTTHPDDAGRVERSLRSVIANGEQRWSDEYRLRKADGSYAYVTGRAHVIHEAGGVPVRVVGAVKDITERRRAEQEIRESEGRFRSVAESAADAILLTESNGTIIFANERAAAMFGVPARDLVGQQADHLLAAHVREETGEAFSALLTIDSSEPASLTMSTFGLRRDGTEFPMEISVSTWRREGQTFLTKILRDVSSRVAAERRQKTQFEVTKLLAASRSVKETIPELIHLLSDGLGWRGGVLWLLDQASQRLGCAGAWISDDHDPAAMIKACGECSFGEGEGLPGRALRSGFVSETLLLPGTQREVPHHAAAAASGIQRATALPLRTSGGTVGVIELFELDTPVPGTAMLDVTADIAGQVAQYIDRMRSEEARVAATERMREAQHLAHVGSWEYDVATGGIEWSEEVYAIFGVEPASFDVTLRKYLRAIHPLDRQRVVRLLREQQRGQQPETIHFQHRIVRHDASERTVECRSRFAQKGSGAMWRVVGTVQDVTEQAAAARTIEELRRRSETILDCAAEGIIGVSRDASIMFVNPAALSLLGCTQEELGNCRDTHDRFHHTKPDGTPYPAEECPILMTLSDGRKRSMTGEFFWRADGSRFAVDYECAPIVENKTIKGCVLTFRDVTESLALERQLDLARRIGSLGRVAATMAHEFNNVLMGINPFAELIRRAAKSDQKVVKAAEQISISVRRGRRVTEEILRFTQPSQPELRSINVREWMRSIEPELHALAGAGVRVSFMIPESPVHAACDAAQLHQVITNLLLNARDASKPGGQVVIALEVRPQGILTITVRDEGPGIPPELLETVFEPLFTTKRTGTGLGLSVVRQIVTQHGGSIDVRNPVGGGAEFTIVLPLSEQMPADDAVSTAPSPMNNPLCRLLVVEDDESVSAGLTALLETEGLVVQVADRGSVVVEAVTNFHPDAVILDLTLPDIDGTEVFRLLRERWPKLPVVFSTGHGGEAELAATLKSGRVDLLRKPYQIEELLAAVQRVVGTAIEAA